MRGRFKYIKEYFEYKNNILGMDLSELASVQDDYYKMDLYDVDYINGSEDDMILKVNFCEVRNPHFNGRGIFKYVHSDIPGFTDITPINLDGILDDVFRENPDSVIDFLYQIYDKIKF